MELEEIISFAEHRFMSFCGYKHNRFINEVYEFFSIVARESTFGANPDIAFAVLHHISDLRLGHAFVGSVKLMREMLLKPGLGGSGE